MGTLALAQRTAGAYFLRRRREQKRIEEDEVSAGGIIIPDTAKEKPQEGKVVADFTPGCTREACTIRDIHSDIQSVGLQVVGISPQKADSHKRFRETHDLPFVLLCDPDKTVARAYDVDGPFGVSVRRATYLIGEDGAIRDAVLADFNIGKHAEFIREAIELRQGA